MPIKNQMMTTDTAVIIKKLNRLLLDPLDLLASVLINSSETLARRFLSGASKTEANTISKTVIIKP